MVLPRRVAYPNIDIPARMAAASATMKRPQLDDFENVAFGTPSIMPPEQWIDRANVSPATDVYNLGCLLCLLLTGSNPFKGASIAELTKDLFAEEEWRPPHEVLAEVRPIMAKMLKKRPEDRFQSADEVADALDRVALQFGSIRWTTRFWVSRLWQRLFR